jgi:hypothetical protein
MWSFCSEAEALERQADGDLHFLESTEATRTLPPSQRRLDPYRVVHKFFRSDSEERHVQYPRRSVEQLRSTAEYLWNLWQDACCERADVETRSSVYVFVMDRCSAVRQEIVTHNVATENPSEMLGILFVLLRFYTDAYWSCPAALLSSPSLAAQSPWYDEHLHESSINSCISTALTTPTSTATAGCLDSLHALALMLHLVISLKRALQQVVASAPSLGLDLLSPLTLALPRQHSARGGGGVSEEEEGAWRILAAVRCGNTTRALRLVSSLPGDSSAAALAPKIKPLLGLWRLLLADKVANKEESLPASAALRMLGVGPEAQVVYIARLWAQTHHTASLPPTLLSSASSSSCSSSSTGAGLPPPPPPPPPECWEAEEAAVAQAEPVLLLNTRSRLHSPAGLSRVLDLFVSLAAAAAVAAGP